MKVYVIVGWNGDRYYPDHRVQQVFQHREDAERSVEQATAYGKTQTAGSTWSDDPTCVAWRQAHPYGAEGAQYPDELVIEEHELVEGAV